MVSSFFFPGNQLAMIEPKEKASAVIHEGFVLSDP